MRVRKLSIENFRGIRSGQVLFDGNTLLVGGNGVGKSTLFEALDLALGPERMFRRPPVDEFDFYAGRYLDDDGQPVEIQVEVVLVDLSPEAQRRFASHLRKWDEDNNQFADATSDILGAADTHEWCLPVLFRGRYSPEEDDFEGGTFFAHPEPVTDDVTVEDTRLGDGRRTFSRDDKRLCGYLYLRPNRTGSRALSLERGTLLDTIVRTQTNTETTLWEEIRAQLLTSELDAPDTELARVFRGLEEHVKQFISLGAVDRGVRIHPSELTRQNIREVLRLFIAAKPGEVAVPFNRLSTGTLNLLVFALLTYIAQLKGDSSVIFAVEEPEIALPPHAQRRLVDFAVARMGQTLVTSHSPYVIERFEPQHIRVIQRGEEGLTGTPVTLPAGFKLKRYRENRRQFAEAVLARGVLVVEGGTEASLIPVVSEVLERDASVAYTPLDLAGISVFDAGNDTSVPLYAPLFRSMGKPTYGVHDTPNSALTDSQQEQAAHFTIYRVIPYAGVEDLLIAEMPIEPKVRFLEAAADRSDYPTECGVADPAPTEAETNDLLRRVLKARKGAYYGYAAALVAEARDVSELPRSLVDLLLEISRDAESGAGAGLGEMNVPTAESGSASDHSTFPGEGSQPAEDLAAPTPESADLENSDAL